MIVGKPDMLLDVIQRAVLRVVVHALEVIGGHEKQFARRGGCDARLVRMDVCTNTGRAVGTRK
jgi:hypothetical protein